LTELDPEVWEQALTNAEDVCQQDQKEVLAAGGLYVIGTERHEARRIDNQLRGRSGRQGDPGESQFYVSLEDDLMRRFGGNSISNIMERLGVEENVPLEAGIISKSIESAQTRVEGFNFDIRKHVLEYDDVVNQQRELIYAQRNLVLTEGNPRPLIWNMVVDEIEGLVATYTAIETDDEAGWDVDGLYNALRQFLPLPDEIDPADWHGMAARDIEAELLDLAEWLYDTKEEQLGAEKMRQLERLVLLRAVDTLWVQHLTDLDELRAGIGLRAYGQRDPLIEYKREAHDMFNGLIATIKQMVVQGTYFANLVPQQQRRRNVSYARGSSGATAPKPAPVQRDKVGRNDPCPCGSGKKYKHCCLRKEMAQR
jgi:preprotein translocase subunit SecA